MLVDKVTISIINDKYDKYHFFLSMLIVLGYFLMFYHDLSILVDYDKSDFYRYISHFINNVIITDKAIIIDIYPL